MADTTKGKLPKIAAYLLVRGQYGSSLQLAFKDANIGEVRVFGDCRMSSDYETPCCVKESPAAAEARTKAVADQNHAFGEMVIRHLNAGANLGAMSERMTARTGGKT